jgi:zinc protease
MLQLTYLYFTQPRKSAEDFKTFMSKEKSQNEHLLDNPGAYFAHKFQQIIFNKNIRRGLTIIDKLNMVNFEDAFKIYQERFKDASDFTFIFVGNFDIDKIKPLLETYLGGLPSNGQKESWKDPAIEKREGLVVSRVQMGKTQKDLVGIHFHGQTNWTEEENYTFNSMIKILNIQLREALREDKGGVYGVGVNGGFSQRPKHAYGINIQFNTEPKRVDELIKTVYENIDSLKNNLVSEEKIIKVQETQRREREMDLKENDFWLNVLQYYDEYGKDIQLLFDYDKQIDGLTAQKIKDAFKKYFDISNHVEVVLEPEK